MSIPSHPFPTPSSSFPTPSIPLRFLTTPPLPSLKATLSIKHHWLISHLTNKIELIIFSEADDTTYRSSLNHPTSPSRLILEQSHGSRLPASEPCSIVDLNQLVIVRLIPKASSSALSSLRHSTCSLSAHPPPSLGAQFPPPSTPFTPKASCPPSGPAPKTDASTHASHKQKLRLVILDSDEDEKVPFRQASSQHLSPPPDLPEAGPSHQHSRPAIGPPAPDHSPEPRRSPDLNTPSPPPHSSPSSSRSGSDGPFGMAVPLPHFSPTPDWPPAMLAAHADSSPLSSSLEPSPRIEIAVVKKEHLSPSPPVPVPRVRRHIAPFRKCAQGHYRKTSSSSEPDTSQTSDDTSAYQKPRARVAAAKDKKRAKRIPTRKRSSSSSYEDEEEPDRRTHLHRPAPSRSPPARKRAKASLANRKRSPSSSWEDDQEPRSRSRPGRKKANSTPKSSSSWEDEEKPVRPKSSHRPAPSGPGSSRDDGHERRGRSGTHPIKKVRVVIEPTSLVAPKRLPRTSPVAPARRALVWPASTAQTPPAAAAMNASPSSGRAQRAVYQIYFDDELFKAAATQGPQRHPQSLSGLNDRTSVSQLVRYLQLDMNASWKLVIGDKVWLSDRSKAGLGSKSGRRNSGVVGGKIVQEDWMVQLKELGVVPIGRGSKSPMVQVIRNWDLE